jgi:small subunit ribosomal protein S20
LKRVARACQQLTGRRWKFNLISTLLGRNAGLTAAVRLHRALTLPRQTTIRPLNGGGCDPAAAVLGATPSQLTGLTSIRLSSVGAALPTEHPEKSNQRRSGKPRASFQARFVIGHCRRTFENMANTTSAKKATRKIARRTIINKSRRTEMRNSVRTVEEAIKRGDRAAAAKAMASAEPELMRAAQRNIIHKNAASRKVSRLAHQIAKLAK